MAGGIGVHTASGTKIRIGGTTEGVGSESAYVLIGSVTNLSEFGPEFGLIEFDDMSDRNTRKFKGQRNDGSITIALGKDLTDSGQADLEAANLTDFDYNFEIEYNDAGTGTDDTPTYDRFKAKVMSFKTNPGDPTSVVAATAVLEIKSGSIERTNAS